MRIRDAPTLMIDRYSDTWQIDRRRFLGNYVGSLGGIALASLLADEHIANAKESNTAPAVDTFANQPGRGKAKNVICLFQHGGPSQMDLFDAKPELTRRHGQPHPDELEVHFHTKQGNLLASPFIFRRHGQSGMELSELLPHTAGVVDNLTLIRSMTTESVDHEAALRLIHTGGILAGRPVWGSWVLYALGSESRDLPSYVVLADNGLPIDGVRNWSSGWLPAQFQGTRFQRDGAPVLHLNTPAGITVAARRRQLDLLKALNTDHAARHGAHTELAARIANFETAARMQTAVPEAVDLADETASTRRLYGLDNPTTADYGRRCLLARRLVERGVRFVQIFLEGQPWDTHSKNAESLKGLCARTDQPSAALVRDLKQRGLLDSTIVMWAGEFGRLPISQDDDGRDHNRHAFSLWLAGGGLRGGYVHGETDPFGYQVVRDEVTIHDLHATLLAALGIDHRRLTHPHEGRADSLSDHEVTGARVVPELLG